MRSRVLAIAVFLVLGAGCRAGGCLAATLGDTVNATKNARCDRRYVTDGGTPSAFCQELIDTVAASEFEDDCRDKHQAAASDGFCPRAKILGGCLLHKKNDDGSIVYDWYYDVADSGVDYKDAPRTIDEVKTFCADPTRYEDGAEFSDTPIPIPDLP